MIGFHESHVSDMTFGRSSLLVEASLHRQITGPLDPDNHKG